MRKIQSAIRKRKINRIDIFFISLPHVCARTLYFILFFQYDATYNNICRILLSLMFFVAVAVDDKSDEAQ